MGGPVRYEVDTGRTNELAAWLRCNDVDPQHVPYPSKVTLESVDGMHWMIRYDTYARTASGTLKFDHRTQVFEYTEVRVEMVTDPPMWWLKEAAPSGLQGTEGAAVLSKSPRVSEDNVADGAFNCD